MSVFRRARNAAAVALLATGVLAGTAGTASAQALPQSPYCFTVDGAGVCIVLTLHVTGTNTPGDLTASIDGQIGFGCPGLTLEACDLLGAIAPFHVGRTGVEVGNPNVTMQHLRDVRVPEVCVPGACYGPYFVPVDRPVVNDGPAVWVNGSKPLEFCIPCGP
jgi:hypothetical protein